MYCTLSTVQELHLQWTPPSRRMYTDTRGDLCRSTAKTFIKSTIQLPKIQATMMARLNLLTSRPLFPSHPPQSRYCRPPVATFWSPSFLVTCFLQKRLVKFHIPSLSMRHERNGFQEFSFFVVRQRIVHVREFGDANGGNFHKCIVMHPSVQCH